MKDNDGRRLSHEALEQLRINAVQRVENGESPETVIKSIGFERVCIYRWIAKYRYGGISRADCITHVHALLKHHS